MNHPLTRLFAPISMVIVIAASSAVMAVTDKAGDNGAAIDVVEMAQNTPDVLDSVVSIQPIPELP